MADQAGQGGAHLAGHQHHRRFVAGFLLADAFGQALVQAFGQARFQRHAVAMGGFLQHALQLRGQGEHRQLGRHAGDFLHDEPA